MANPYSSACQATGRAKMKALGGSTYARGGSAKGGSAIKSAIMAHEKRERAAGLNVHGKKGGGRLDKPRRDKGGMHKRTKLNVSAPKGISPDMLGGDMAPPMPPSPTPMPPPGMSAGPMPMPGMMKRGGFIKKARGGAVKLISTKYPYLKGGVESGEGRLRLSKSQAAKR